jgi:hypothetical protein
MWFDTLASASGSPSDRAIIWHHAGHHHVLPPSLGRRQFLRAMAGGAALGAALGTGLLRPPRVEGAEADIENVVPIPGTFEFGGQEFHVLSPPLSAPDDDPSTVFNFLGATGIASISGMCTVTTRRTGERRELPFRNNDMRFMQGLYKGEDGKRRVGTFALV